MLKEKWKKLELREKVLLISGILYILSIPLTLISLCYIIIAIIFFIVSVFYNIYKLIQMTNLPISETIERDIQKKQEESEESKEEAKSENTKRLSKPLTEEQINEIHSRGKITPAEKVKEWESMDLCAPGEAVGSTTWRCEKFGYCCHDCLVPNQKMSNFLGSVQIELVFSS